MRKTKQDWMNKGDNVLVRVVLILASLLVLSQLVLLKDSGRMYLSRVDKLEGEQISLQLQFYAANSPLEITDKAAANTISFRSGREIIIRMIQPARHSEVYVTVNGQNVGDFRQGMVKVTVYDGDYVEIDATSLPEKAQFTVSAAGRWPALAIDGLVLETKASVAVIGKINF